MTDERFDSTVTTTCGYCGVGCRLEAHARGGKIASISPALDGPANEGHTCLKGRFAHQFSRSRDRLTAPLVREGDGFRLASWDEAIGLIVGELSRIKADHGPDAIAGLASSRATNEDCYAMARFMRAAIGTNNIDNCSRVCHSPTSYALRKAFGLSGATGSFADIDSADAAILIGANPTEGHPVVGARIKQATLRGMRLVTIDPRRIELADYGVLHLAPRPGTNAAVMLGLCHVVARDGLDRRARSSTRGPRASRRSRSCSTSYAPDAVEEITGVPAADLEARRAHLRARRPRPRSSWGLGVTEHRYGSEVVQLICNLALMTGKVGRPGSALLPLRGQNNVQGSSDMGALPDTYTAYRSVDDEEVAQSFERGLGRAAAAREGLHDPADVRRRGRRASEGDVDLRRGRRADRPEHRARRARARVARVPGLPGHLRDRDDQVRGRDPAGLGVPREGGHVHQRRAAHPARRARDRPAGIGADRLRHHHDDLARAGPRHGLVGAGRRDGRDRAR